MGDQAETLRKLMQSRLPPQERRGGDSPLVLTFTECGSPGEAVSSARVLQALLGLSFAGEGIRALLVDCGGNRKYSGSRPQGPWYARVALQECSAPREGLLRELEGVCPAADVILVTACAREGILPDAVYGPARGNILVLGEGRDALEEATTLVKTLRRGAGVTRVGVIVKEVAEPMRARKLHSELSRHLEGRFIDAHVEFLGSFFHEKKFLHTVIKPDFLINLNQEARVNATVGVLSKRLREKYLNLELKREVAGGRVRSRFQEEPAQVAPGNLAGFWRTLLGEVKA